jgi:hypothetical protein
MEFSGEQAIRRNAGLVVGPNSITQSKGMSIGHDVAKPRAPSLIGICDGGSLSSSYQSRHLAGTNLVGWGLSLILKNNRYVKRSPDLKHILINASANVSPIGESQFSSGCIGCGFSGFGLSFEFAKRPESCQNAADTYQNQSYVWGIFRTKETLELALRFTRGPLAR